MGLTTGDQCVGRRVRSDGSRPRPTAANDPRNPQASTPQSVDETNWPWLWAATLPAAARMCAEHFTRCTSVDWSSFSTSQKSTTSAMRGSTSFIDGVRLRVRFSLSLRCRDGCRTLRQLASESARRPAGVKRAALTSPGSRGGGWAPRLPEQQWLTQTAFCRDSQQQIPERETLAR